MFRPVHRSRSVIDGGSFSGVVEPIMAFPSFWTEEWGTDMSQGGSGREDETWVILRKSEAIFGRRLVEHRVKRKV